MSSDQLDLEGFQGDTVMLSRISELSFQSGVIFRRDRRILRVLCLQKRLLKFKPPSRVWIWKSVKLQSSAARTSTELDQLEAVQGLPHATPRKHTLDILWILGQHHPMTPACTVHTSFKNISDT
jgi:hypothetical protein